MRSSQSHTVVKRCNGAQFLTFTFPELSLLRFAILPLGPSRCFLLYGCTYHARTLVVPLPCSCSILILPVPFLPPVSLKCVSYTFWRCWKLGEILGPLPKTFHEAIWLYCCLASIVWKKPLNSIKPE
jgi:hypothetical protein